MVSSSEAQSESACCASNAKVSATHTCDEGEVEVSCEVRNIAILFDKALVLAMRRQVLVRRSVKVLAAQAMRR